MMLLGILLFSFGLFSSVIAFDGSETLSPRSVNTKYGSLRGIIVYFKTYDRNYVSGVPGKPGSSSSSSSSGTSSSSSSGSGGTSGQTKSASLPPLKPVEVFLGVPYATPPVGSLRFMPPVTPAHWRGVKLANRFGPVCPQKPPEINLWSDNGRTNQTNGKSSFGGTNINSNININNNSGGGKNYGSKNQLPDGRVSYLKRIMPFLRNQSEDCLYLNIYAPFTQDEVQLDEEEEEDEDEEEEMLEHHFQNGARCEKNLNCVNEYQGSEKQI